MSHDFAGFTSSIRSQFTTQPGDDHGLTTAQHMQSPRRDDVICRIADKSKPALEETKSAFKCKPFHTVVNTQLGVD